MTPPEVGPRIDRFKSDLGTLSIPLMVQKHITFGSCYILDEERYFELKARIADRFSLHPSEVIIVGSGKLGFSIAPHQRWKHFGDRSDIDVAVVSSSLFDLYWMQVFRFKAERN